MMRRKEFIMEFTTLPEWLLTPLFGAEDGDEGEGESTEEPTEDEESEGTEEHSEGEGGEEKSKGDGAYRALQAERAARRAAEREAKALKREKQQREQAEADAKLKEEDAIKAAQVERDRERERANALAEKLKVRTVDALIRDAARDLNFYDPADALLQIDRSAIKVEQDTDDPTDIEVDEKSVKAAVKALADKKKHLIKAGGDGQQSGGRFGGKGGSNGDKDDKGPASRFRI